MKGICFFRLFSICSVFTKNHQLYYLHGKCSESVIYGFSKITLNYRNSAYHMCLVTPIISRKKSTISVIQLRIKHDLINH